MSDNKNTNIENTDVKQDIQEVKAEAQNIADAATDAAEKTADAAIDTAANPSDGIKKANKGKKAKERSRNPFHIRQLRYGGYAIVLTVVAVILVMLVNMVFAQLENNFAWKLDLSYNQRFSISDTTKDVVSNLTEDVHIYTLMSETSSSSLGTQLEEMLNRYRALGHIEVKNLDIVANPLAANKFVTDGQSLAQNSIVVANAEETKFKVISSADMYDIQYDSQTYQVSSYDFVGEQAVTSAILYVTSANTPVVYFLQGHGETAYSALTFVQTALSSQNYETQEYMLSSDAALEAGNVLMVVAPTSDLSDDERDIVKEFLEAGGRMYYASSYSSGELKNFESLLSLYGAGINHGLVVEDLNSNRYFRHPLYLMPYIQIAEDNAVTTAFDSSSYVMLPESQAIVEPEMKQSGVVYTDVLLTSANAYIKTGVDEQNTSIEKADGDATGTFPIAVAIAEDDYDDSTKSTRIFVIGNSMFLQAESVYGYYDNEKLLLSPMEWLVNRNTTVYVSSKSMGTPVMTIPDNTTYNILTVMVIVVMPVLVLVVGFIIWRRRRHL